MRTDFVQTGDVKLQYFEHGAGPELLVLVHGYRSSARIWRLVQEALDPARFRSLAISNRGAGDSDRTAAEADYTVESSPGTCSQRRRHWACGILPSLAIPWVARP